MGRKKFIKTYNYQCSLTDKSFTTTREAPHPDRLISIQAFYQLNPEEDDRPESIKLQERETETVETRAEAKMEVAVKAKAETAEAETGEENEKKS